VAQYNLGVMLSTGQGCEKNIEKAVNWFEQAGRLGMPEAQIAVGDAYRSGDGVVADPEAARYWYQQAASQNHQVAINRLEALS
jgi:TPR repeat protein